MRIVGFLMAPLLALGLAAGIDVPAASAQPAGPPPAAQPSKPERIKKRIRALRAYTLTEELALDEATAGKLFPLLARYDDDFDKLLHLRVDLQQRLDGAASLKDPRAIDKIIDEAIANQRAFWDLEDRRLVELRKILTPGQIARLLIVLPAIERKIQNQLRNAIQKERAARPGKAGADDDDDPDEPGAPPAPRRPRKPAKTGDDSVCDPFSNVHGCRK